MVQVSYSQFLALVAMGLAVYTSAHVQDTAQYLFPYERNHLTHTSLRDLIKSSGVSTKTKFFNFDKEKGSTKERLKSGSCKVFPGDAAWPSQAVWGDFSKLLGGALIETIPIAAPCYENLGIFDREKCAAIRENWADPYLHESDPTSVFFPIYQGRSCMPTDDPTSSNCTLGGFPVYSVNVSNVQQIQLAINFARNANLRLVIKNTGHDYLGKSSGAGALSIWTHNLKDMTFYPELTIPGYSGPALKIGAGVTVREMYAKAHEHGVSALGGICESVGYAGGYVAGGGHTPLSGLYGMAADHVMALEVVTADGRFVTASPEENPDLFWALRGGGGATYGVVTSVITRVHPKTPVVTSQFTFSTSANVSTETFWEGLRSYFEHFIPFTDAGTYSWWTLMTTTGKDFTFTLDPFFAPNHTIESFNALVKPWFDRLTELGIPFTPNTKFHTAFYPAYNATWGSDPTLSSGGSVSYVPGNYILPRKNWESPDLFNATFSTIYNHSTSGRLLFGYHQAPRNRANVDNAVSPAFRHAISFLILSAGLPGPVVDNKPTVSQIKTATDDLINNILPPFRAVAPETEQGQGGSYLNEANADQPNWQASFYGEKNYARLLKIKNRYDPLHVFYAPTAVGSEGWEVSDGEQGAQTQNGRLCRL
ncbi:6-hydroxy-D-nicotine oxidase [Rhypophila decipiens]|uniref:6-hydroxy-D-nicotine oxidase n=1 Tax=Rhypophila decipiens TaxID=261697 RepID=A0AAN6Y1I0_9PEZI|nr:6-hydroxy-D-nicotine oxidase [Rhypophila decipiens]